MPGRHPSRDKSQLPDAGGVSGSSTLENWHQCVKNLTVSSRENRAHVLVDGEHGYWQSSGTQGKVSERLWHFQVKYIF